MQKRQKPRRLRKPGKTGQLQKEGNLKTRKPQAFKNHESAKTRKCKMGKPEVWYGVVDLYGYDSYGELFSIYDLQLCPFLLLRLFCFSRFLGCIVLAGWHFYVLRVSRPNNKGNCQGRDMACPCDVHVMFMSCSCHPKFACFGCHKPLAGSKTGCQSPHKPWHHTCLWALVDALLWYVTRSNTWFGWTMMDWVCRPIGN